MRGPRSLSDIEGKKTGGSDGAEHADKDHERQIDIRMKLQNQVRALAGLDPDNSDEARAIMAKRIPQFDATARETEKLIGHIMTNLGPLSQAVSATTAVRAAITNPSLGSVSRAAMSVAEIHPAVRAVGVGSATRLGRKLTKAEKAARKSSIDPRELSRLLMQR